MSQRKFSGCLVAYLCIVWVASVRLLPYGVINRKHDCGYWELPPVWYHPLLFNYRSGGGGSETFYAVNYAFHEFQLETCQESTGSKTRYGSDLYTKHVLSRVCMRVFSCNLCTFLDLSNLYKGRNSREISF